jgi:hypothetical protein
LVWDGMAENIRLICCFCKSEYFCEADLTKQANH